MKRHRVLLAVAAVGLLAGACRESTHVHASSGSAPDVVPWKDDPLSPEVATTTSTTSALPQCEAADLVVTGGQGGGAAGGTVYWRASVTNGSQSSCQLQSQPVRLTALDERGRRVELRQLPTYSPPVELAPAEHGTVILSATDLCRGDGAVTPSVKYSGVVADVQGGALALPGMDLVLCPDAPDQAVDTMFIPDTPPENPPPPAAGSPGTLEARFAQPPTPVPGAVVTFVVVLTNPTDTDVSFDPCPAYQEGAYPSILTYRLNCDSVTVVRPHESVSYEMQAKLASDAMVAKFFWRLVPDGSYAKG